MAGVGSLARRVRRLEEGRAKRSPVVVMFGSFDAFEAHCDRAIRAGALDAEFRDCVEGLRVWEVSGVWADKLRDHAFVKRSKR